MNSSGRGLDQATSLDVNSTKKIVDLLS